VSTTARASHSTNRRSHASSRAHTHLLIPHASRLALAPPDAEERERDQMLDRYDTCAGFCQCSPGNGTAVAVRRTI